MSLLEVKNLVVEFPGRRGTLRALDDVSFAIAPGEILGMVGESGAGKSLTGAAIIGLLEPPGRVAGGQIVLEGERHVEGDDLGNGVVLHEISADGMVLDFKGQRFLYPRDGR